MELVEKLSNRQYIDGEWVESSNKNTRDIINPYNQEVIFTVAKVLLKMQKEQYLRRRAFEDAEWSLETSEVRGKK